MCAAITPAQITELRNAFLEDLNTKGEDSIHPKDLTRVKTDDDWLRRFLKQNDLNLKEALNMMWEALTWRKEFGVNEINETSIKNDILINGGFFPRGRDKDGCKLFIFKCKKYIKGQHNADDLKRCVVYWFERLEREEKGQPITLFFDMESCGLANMDMEFTKYLIGLFKQYYPSFLNYILIFEMPWILNAAFKIIKSWLPEKAVQKIKFISKKDIKDFVPLEQALTCWGGTDDYSFSFLPEPAIENTTALVNSTGSNRKVHFADGSPMSDSPGSIGDKNDGSPLSVQPTPIITFIKDANNELVSTLDLHNTDTAINLSYKFKTTSPEKFRVRPSAGCLAPGGRATITVTVLPGFQVGNLSRDKFLVMSQPTDTTDLNPQDLADLWKNTSGKKLYQHHLKCTQKQDPIKNGSAGFGSSPETDHGSQSQLLSKINNLEQYQTKLHSSLKTTQYFQIATIILLVLLSIAVLYVYNSVSTVNERLHEQHNAYCENPRSPVQ